MDEESHRRARDALNAFFCQKESDGECMEENPTD
jgi:hypothetical protein